MRQVTASPSIVEQQDSRPPDIEEMRASTDLLLGPDGAPDVLPPTADELATLTEALREYLELLATEVARAAGKLDKESIPRYCALACVGEARERLRAQPSYRFGGPPGHARRLARALNALCDHYENLSGER